MLLTLHLPYSRVYVSLSDGFPVGLCFLDHRSLRCIGLDSLLASSTCLQESCVGLLRSESSFVAVLGLHFTPGYFLCEHEFENKKLIFREWERKPSTFHRVPFGPGPSVVLACLDLRRFNHAFNSPPG